MNPILFVSLGSGDPDLITLKALKALQNADVILCPCTTSKEGKVTSRSQDIMLELDILTSKIKLFNVSMRKERSQVMKEYQDAANQAYQLHNEGLAVAIVAEGDSGFYSSSQYINENLQALNVPTKRIEGVPAFISCGALANIHIVKQEEQLLVIPGETTAEELNMHIQSGKSIVIMKPSQCQGIIKNVASSSDNNIDIHYFENVGVVEKEFYTQNKDEILNRKFPYFSLLIIQKNIK